MRAALFTALVLAGCYKPGIAPCQYECLNGACPDTLVCNSATNRCVANAGDRCDAIDDSGVDVDALGDGPPCTFVASNVDGCMLGIENQQGDWHVFGADLVTIDTSGGGSISPATADAQFSITGTPPNDVMVILTKNLTIDDGANFRVIGTRPLVILANGTISSSGNVYAKPPPLPVGATYCNTGNGGRGTGSNPGGGGGSYGPPLGGRGGPNATSGGAAGAMNGGAALTPLRFGCTGGDGVNTTTPTNLAVGGRGGGAIQMSARVSITLFDGMIEVPGQGGVASTDPTIGAGGGGAGGSIFLEAPDIILGGVAKVCANGGGGGAVNNFPNGNGQDGQCSKTAALGGTGTPNGGAGAFGGTAGTAGGAAATAGTGGGGGVGRIRFHGNLQPSANVIITPAASVTP